MRLFVVAMEKTENCKLMGLTPFRLFKLMGLTPFRVIRGASWGNVAADCRSARRFYNNPSTAYNSIGFRVVLAPQ